MTADPLTPRRRGARRAPWVLMYHSVGDPRDDPYLITVGPDRLAAQLRWLNRHGLTGVSMRELLAARAAGRDHRLVGLTFDDGYADFLRLAVPALRQYGHTATVFVLPGRLGGSNDWDPDGPRKPLLDADGIREAAGAGMEIGSHGLLHRDLTALDDAALAAEVSESRALLAEVTGTPPVGFCYPYGVLDARAVLAVRDAGYTYGCAITPGPLTSVLALPRTHVGNREAAPRLHAKRLLHGARSRRLTALREADATALTTAGQYPDRPEPLSESPGGHP
jgi:peptidoglycan/xylan/chitin deacetylase (PgdA/CDA1 family)